MRKVIFAFSALLCSAFVVVAQPYLFSATYGKRGDLPIENPHGTVSKFDVATNKLTIVYSFEGADGSHPAGKLIQASDGSLYGVTSEGGAYNAGVLFSVHPVTNKYTKLHDFNIENGASPASHVIQGVDGKLYGMTTKGGLHGMGIIYSFDILTKKITKIFDFNGPDGAFPTGGLLQASDGKLYGMTPEGGALLYGSLEFTSGILFSFDLLSNTFTKLREFGTEMIPDPPYYSIPDGAKPYGSLIQAKDGKLYGTTAFGGSSTGTIFSYDLVTKNYFIRTIHSFGQFHPYASLCEASNGLLYGLTNGGGTMKESGVAFSYNPGENMLNLMGISYMATYPEGPLRPKTSFIQASNGKLYGITEEVGPAYGFIFSHNSETQEFLKKSSFNGTNGANPVGALTEYIPCTNAFKISIPDVSVLPKGVQKNTVYPGYAPAASIKLGVQAPSGNYTYKWSNGSTTPSITVAPAKTTTYSVVITDRRGCTATAVKEIKAVNVHCGNKGDKVAICKGTNGSQKKSEENCVSTHAVAEQLAKGASLGNCTSGGKTTEEIKNGLSVKVLPNPSSNYFTLNINSSRNERVSLIVVDMKGRMVDTKLFTKNTVLQIGQNFKPGTYFAIVLQRETSVTVKLIKQ